MPRLRRGPVERISAWATTGPPGHAWSALADVSVFWARWARQRMLSGAGRRPRSRR